MSAIGKGDWVQCIHDGNIGNPGEGWYPEEAIVAGRVYVVADCFTGPQNVPCVDLVGRSRHRSSEDYGERVGYAVRRFKPLGGNSLAQTRKAPQDVLVNFGPYFKQPVPAGFEPWD